MLCVPNSAHGFSGVTLQSIVNQINVNDRFDTALRPVGKDYVYVYNQD